MGYVSQWGGMDVGSGEFTNAETLCIPLYPPLTFDVHLQQMKGMLFPAAVIDGLVHQLGGKQLQNECAGIPKHPLSHAYENQQSTHIEIDSTVKCPVGTAVITSAGGKELQAEYDNIIHTVPPFYKYPPSQTKELTEALGIHAELFDEESWCFELLKSCYRHSFQLAFGIIQRSNTQGYGMLQNALQSIGLAKQQILLPENQRVAVPLLGAGCRGFPTSMALNAAAVESVLWLKSSNNQNISDDTLTKQNGIIEMESIVAFGLLETSDAEQLAAAINESL
jgi:O-acetyl-ADP-ribose deacetylase (regulator of RNase III)